MDKKSMKKMMMEVSFYEFISYIERESEEEDMDFNKREPQQRRVTIDVQNAEEN